MSIDGKQIENACNALIEQTPNAHVLVAVYQDGFVNYSHSMAESGNVVAFLRALATLIEKSTTGSVTVEDAMRVERSTKAKAKR